MIDKLRNIAIIAHVDHGKTTLVDKLLGQSDTLGEREQLDERAMDSNDLEKERGITITAKNTSIRWQDYKINIIDTPGHADFGGEVERIMSMADSVLLLVDAVDGPMPQTRFVTQKAFAANLKPIVVINKVDKPGARIDWVIDQIFDLFVALDANDEQLDFPIVYASALNGFASLDMNHLEGDMTPLFQTIVDKVSPPQVEVNGPLQMQVTSLAYSTYLGPIAIGRVSRGTIKPGMQVSIVSANGEVNKHKIATVQGYLGLDKVDVPSADAGDIVAITGITKPEISDTICDPETIESLPPLTVDEPTMNMTFQVNTSPFAGTEGKFVTSRNILDRLDQELLHNVALRVERTDSTDKFKVSGRGELHLSILIETMRREGYEMGISRPEVIIKEVDGVLQEPYEDLVIDVNEEHQGSIIEQIGKRKGDMNKLELDGKGRVRLEFVIPSRGLIGFQTEFLTMTSGTGLMYHTFKEYGPHLKESIAQRSNGVLVSGNTGKALAYSIFNLQERAKMMIEHGDKIYEGMIVGINSRTNDLVVNPLKGKQLTNVRASGTDDAILLVPAIKFTLEQALEFIDDDELVEVTPLSIRIRKTHLTENERKRANKGR